MPKDSDVIHYVGLITITCSLCISYGYQFRSGVPDKVPERCTLSPDGHADQCVRLSTTILKLTHRGASPAGAETDNCDCIV